MKRIRKSVSLLVTLIMALSLLPQMAMAATVQVPSYTNAYESYFYGWSRATDVTTNETNAYSCVTNEIAHGGDHSLALRYATNGPQGSWLIVRPRGLSLGEGTYTLSFWSAENDDDDIWCKLVQIPNTSDIASGSEHSTGGWAYTYYAATGKKEGIWKEYSLNFTVPAGQTVTNVGIATNGNTKGWYIDDVSLTKQGTTDNLIKNAGFEEKTAEYTNEYKDYFTGWSDWSGATADNNLKFMCVTDEKVHMGAHSIVIRHVGEQGNNQNICLAQSGLSLEAGTYTISFWAVGTKTDSDIQGVTLADPWRKYSMKNRQPVETDGIWSKYEIEVTMDGTETAMTFVTDGDTESWYIDDISLTKEGTTDNRIKNGGFEFTDSAAYTDKYEDYFNGWTRWDAIGPDKNLTFSCVTDAIAHDGNNSAVIKHSDPDNAWKAIVIAQEGLSLTGTYTVSFWAAGDYDVNKNCITVNGEAWEDYYLNDFTVSQSDGLWKKYTIDITIPDGKTNNAITFASNGNTKSWYIDDISLIKAGTSQNLIKNGGFESTGAPVYTNEYKDYFTGWSDWSGATADNKLKFMCVTDEIAHTGDRSILIRHVGEQGNNQNMCLAQSELGLEAGTYTISFWAVGTKTDSDIQGVTLADPWRKYSMKNLQPVETDGIWSKYEIEVTMDGTETAMTFMTDGDTQGWYIDDISLIKKGTTNNRIKNGGFEFTNNAAYTDKYEDYFAGWSRWDAITPDKNLTFSCVTDAIAHDGNNSAVIRHSDPDNAWKAIVIAQEGLSLTGTYTVSFWATGDYDVNTNCITVNGEAWEDYYLNDFTVSQTDGLWKKYTIDITIPDGKTNNAITFTSNGNTKSWYIDDISLIKAGTSQNLIKNGGFEYKGANGYYISEPKFMKINGSDKTQITALEAGQIEVSMEIANYTMGDNFAPIMIVALYEGGVLKKMESVQQNVYPRQAEGFLEDELSVTVDVPQMAQDSDYALKVMCWDGLETLLPLTGAKTIK
ncbi:MAG: hypothetical protein IJT23_09170 [Clostridia bacterium]|nr:hypothetical protein [Clostridia bacterium]